MALDTFVDGNPGTPTPTPGTAITADFMNPVADIKNAKETTVNALRYNGGAFNATTINAALTAIGANVRRLYLSSGNWTIDANVSVPANIQIVMDVNAVLVRSGSFTFTFNSKPTIADQGQHFSGSSGFIIFASPKKPKMYSSWWGTKGDGTTEDIAACRAACKCLQDSGGGHLHFPYGTYRIYSDSSNTNMGTFSSLEGVKITGESAIFHVDRAFTGSQQLTIFSFDYCTKIFIDGIKVTQTTSTPGQTLGPGFLLFTGSSRKINIPILDTQGFSFALRCTAASSDTDTDRVRGLRVGQAIFKDNYYGFNFQFSGDNFRCPSVRILGQIHRTYFPYGVKDHKITIHSINNQADDALLRGYEGKGLENIELAYYNLDSDNAATAAPGVALAPGDETPATFRNIRIKVHVRHGSAGPGHGIHIYKNNNAGSYDTSDRGHIFENICISGLVEGTPSGGGVGIKTDGTWNYSGGTKDKWRGFCLKNFSSRTESIFLGFLNCNDNHATLQNVYADDNRGIYIGGNTTNRTLAINCRAGVMSASGSDAYLVDYLSCTIADNTNQSKTGKRFYNVLINGKKQPNSQEVIGLYSSTNTSLARLFISEAAGDSAVASDNAGADLRLDAGAGNVVRNAILALAQSSHATQYADLQHVLSVSNASSALHAALALLRTGIVQILKDSGTIAANTLLSSVLLEMDGLSLAYTNGQRMLKVPGGWTPYALPIGHTTTQATSTALAIAANGGSFAIPIVVSGHMLFQSLLFYNTDTSGDREIEWQLFRQSLNNGISGEATVTYIPGASGTESWTAAAANNRNSNATGAPIYLHPGTYWLVVRNTHASNTFGIGTASTNWTLARALYQTQVLGSSIIGSNLDLVTGWTRVGTVAPAVLLRGRVLGETGVWA